MQAAQLDGEAFLIGTESERISFINQEINSCRPFTHPNIAV